MEDLTARQRAFDRILIVEDDDEVLSAVRLALRDEGFEVDGGTSLLTPQGDLIGALSSEWGSPGVIPAPWGRALDAS